MSQGNVTVAIEAFNRALEIDPNLSRACLNRGLALLILGRDNDAQKDFDRCLAENPELRDEVEARAKLARELRVTGRSEFRD